MDFAEFARTAWFGPLDTSGLRLLENDLAIGDAPLFRGASEAIAAASSAAMERHLAANWLNGGSETYSDTDVSTWLGIDSQGRVAHWCRKACRRDWRRRWPISKVASALLDAEKVALDDDQLGTKLGVSRQEINHT